MIDTIDYPMLDIDPVPPYLIDTVDNPFCQIYLDAVMELDELVEMIAFLTGGQDNYSTVTTPCSQILVAENEDCNEILRTEFPGGFVYFRYTIEVDALSDMQRSDYIQHIAHMLEHFWSYGLPAVALCDFEHELPNRGGFRSCEIPWLAPGVSMTIPTAVVAR